MLMLLSAAVLAGCRKKYTCTCFGNPVFEVKATKKKADQQCKDYETSAHITEAGGSCEIK